jgi:hypothetical protein
VNFRWLHIHKRQTNDATDFFSIDCNATNSIDIPKASCSHWEIYISAVLTKKPIIGKYKLTKKKTSE